MLLPATALFALATTALAQSCNTVRDPAHPPNGKQFVCGRQGALARPQLSRSFVSPTGDASGCADLCFSDPNCLSFSFRNDNSQCQTYTQNVRAQGFSRKSNTGDFFFFTRCFTKTGDCGIANGGFEDGPTSDDDDVGESTTYRPWSFKSGGDPEGLNSAMLVDNSMDSDSGDGERFM